MKWMIVASLTIAVFLAPAYGQQAEQVAGTCASIGYLTSCCPRGGKCVVSIVMAIPSYGCGDDCHAFGDCCSDVACPINPRTCADVGITQCCNETADGISCEVRDMSHEHYCSCNVSCHARNDCCMDAATFCVPRTCADAGKGIGCCQWSTNPFSSCYVPGGNCYCDGYCTVFGDCCDDVLPHCPSANIQSWWSQQSRVQSVLAQELMASQVQNYYRGRGANTAADNSGYTHHRMALAARTQWVRGNTNTASYREFRQGRARVAERRPPGPPPYGY